MAVFPQIHLSRRGAYYAQICIFGRITCLDLWCTAIATDISGFFSVKITDPKGEETFDIVVKAAGESVTIEPSHPIFQKLSGIGIPKGNGDSITRYG